MIAIVEYNAGNIRSVQNALSRLGHKSIVTNDFKALKNAEKVIFPGVGEASSAMNYLKERELDHFLPTLTQPFLGICLGLQLMCQSSEEGHTKCLGIFDAKVKKFSSETELVPHMGWNNLSDIKNPLFQNISEKADDFYFVHSFYAEKSKETAATCHYITPFSAALQKDNFYAVQFHPEKSAEMGETLLNNFLML